MSRLLIVNGWLICGVKNGVNENIRGLLREDKKSIFKWK